MNQRELIIFTGIPASGKSTFYLKNFSKTHVRVNLDTLKTRVREWAYLQECLNDNKSIVADNTNPTMLNRARYLPEARKHGLKTISYYFTPTNLEEHFKRNKTRFDKDPIPEVAIKDILNKLEPISGGEDFDERYLVTLQNNDFVVTCRKVV